jgi:bifunctional non-homologous end joining protein LigD
LEAACYAKSDGHLHGESISLFVRLNHQPKGKIKMNAVMEAQDRVTLYYREGSSDKVYQASIEQAGERFVVNFAYGRRGTTLNTGTKTNVPVDYASAKRIFDKLVQEKKGKGYAEGEDGTPYQNSEKQVSGILPQLLNPIEEAEMNKLMRDSAYCAQEKFDGRRVLVRKQGETITGVNKKGVVIGLSDTIVKASLVLPGNYIVDGECVGERLYVFDLLELDGNNFRPVPYNKRLTELLNLMAKAMQRNIIYSETAFSPAQKTILLKDLKRGRKEGIVFKRLDAPYTPGRPNSGGSQLKHKFCATLSAVVAKVNDKRSVEVRLLDEEGWQPAGNVTIPANAEIPSVGQVVEIRYLYAFKESGCLFQPVFLGKRSDVTQFECTTKQLKFKATEE